MRLTKERMKQLRAILEKYADEKDDVEILTVPEFVERWQVGISYEAGQRVGYDGKVYKVLQAHTSQDSWTPSDAPSLFAELLIPGPEVIPDWVQPGSTNGYSKGDKVKHNGSVWESLIDNNVWEPGATGTEALWAKL